MLAGGARGRVGRVSACDHRQQRGGVGDRCVIGPAVSCAAEIGTIPDRLTSPSVGLMPTTPQAAAGETIEPSVSVPIASGASPAATAIADPELEPDGLRPARAG